MQNKEEKKAIEQLKSWREYIVNHRDSVNKANDIEFYLRTALNLIEKQQKELEQEKEKNKELENADLTTVYLDGVYDGEKKWKDKIKAKIEYYKTIDNTVGIRVLEKLLEE